MIDSFYRTPYSNTETLVAKLRQLQRLSQPELAKEIGVHYTTLCRYERRKVIPSNRVIKRMVDYFGNVSFEDLYSDFHAAKYDHLYKQKTIPTSDNTNLDGAKQDILKTLYGQISYEEFLIIARNLNKI